MHDFEGLPSDTTTVLLSRSALHVKRVFGGTGENCRGVLPVRRSQNVSCNQPSLDSHEGRRIYVWWYTVVANKRSPGILRVRVSFSWWVGEYRKPHGHCLWSRSLTWIESILLPSYSERSQLVILLVLGEKINSCRPKGRPEKEMVATHFRSPVSLVSPIIK